MKFRLLLWKRLVENGLMFPLIMFGRMISILRPLPKQYERFFFFPFYHTGGAEKVHSLIAKATGGENCIIFFTRKSHNTTFYQTFADTGCEMRDISRYTDNKLFYFLNIIFRGIITGYINRQVSPPVVFNGQSNFGYKISPWVTKGIRQVELIHSISNFSYIRMPFLPFIEKTVMISMEKIKEHLSLYRKFGVPESYDAKIHYIANASEFDLISVNDKDYSGVTVLYSGRATVEKRSHLVAEIAKRVHAVNPAIQFVMVGDEFASLRSAETSFMQFKGNIADQNELKTVYLQSHVLLITSSTEGFPLAVIEGMAYGTAILSTPGGDLPIHVRENQNGFLFSSVQNEEKIIQEGADHILRLADNKERLKEIAANNIQYAQENFSFRKFAEAYHQIIHH